MVSQMVYNIIRVLGSYQSLRVYNILACAYEVSDGLQFNYSTYIVRVLWSNKSLRVYNILAGAYGIWDGLQYNYSTWI